MLRMTGGGLWLRRSGVDADGVADVFEAVALEERREAALEYGDLLRSAVQFSALMNMTRLAPLRILRYACCGVNTPADPPAMAKRSPYSR